MRSDIQSAIVSTYGSLAEPSYRLVDERMASAPHVPLLLALVQVASVRDATDPKDHCGSVFVLEGSCWLYVSVVGPYAALFRWDGARCVTVQTPQTPQESAIARLCLDCGFELLGQAEISEQLAFAGCDNVDGEPTVFNALFATRDIAPWDLAPNLGHEPGLPLETSVLVEMEARCESASPGPWRSMVEGRDHECGSSFIMTGTPECRGPDIELSGATGNDQEFIAHARTDVPRLLAEIRRLRTTAPAEPGAAAAPRAPPAATRARTGTSSPHTE